MKVVAGMIALNESDYIYWSLKSFYNVVDKIIIVEGCEPIMTHAASSEGLSLDNTAEIIRNFPDPDKKIQFIQRGFQEQFLLRQEVLENVPKDTDIFFFPDADELYDEDELIEAFKYQNLRRKIPVGRLWFNHVMFMTYDLIKYDDFVGTISMLAIRCYKYFPDLQMRYPEVVIPLRPGCWDLNYHRANLYHFGWCHERSREKLLQKGLWTIKRHVILKTGDYPDCEGMTDSEMLAWGEKNMTLLNEEKFKNAKPNLIKFTGEYPKVLKEMINAKKMG